MPLLLFFFVRMQSGALAISGICIGCFCRLNASSWE